MDYFPIRTLVTSRGCPGGCATFCGSKGMWGRRVTFHSADYVLDMLEKSVTRHGQKYIAFKDDTFTTNRTGSRYLPRHPGPQAELDLELRHPVDRLDEELLYCMRMAGCQRISLGVESGSPGILKNIKKRISPDEVWKATRLAQKYGLWVRFYMMTGNRGKTPETAETRAFIEKARPNELITCPSASIPERKN